MPKKLNDLKNCEKPSKKYINNMLYQIASGYNFFICDLLKH